MKKIVSLILTVAMVLSMVSIMATADGPQVVDVVPKGITILGTEYDASASRTYSWAVHSKAVQCSQEDHSYSYNVGVDAGKYDLYAFYSTRSGDCYIEVLVDGDRIDYFEVPESIGWAKGTKNIKLTTLDLTAGKHVITFTFQQHMVFNYYFLESFTLVPLTESGEATDEADTSDSSDAAPEIEDAQEPSDVAPEVEDTQEPSDVAPEVEDTQEPSDSAEDAPAADDSYKNPFEDIKDGDWYYESVKTAFENKLMNGTTETAFAPNEKVTRAMFVTVLHRMSGDEKETMDIPFADVAMDSYYAKAVAWAKRCEIVGGVSENEFAPDSIITREQMSAMMQRFAKYKGIDTEASKEDLAFSDASEISEYAVSAINWAVNAEIMKGNPDGSFAPKNQATRAEAATVLVRILNLIK